MEILSSSSVPRGFSLNWTRSRVEMQPLGAVGTWLWVQADEQAPQGYDTGHCHKVRGSLTHKAVKCNLTAYCSPQSPGPRPGEAGHSWALQSHFPTRCSPFSGCLRQVRLNLQRAVCLQPQMVRARAVLKGRGALLKTLQVSEKWVRYLKLWLHQRDFRFCISLPVLPSAEMKMMQLHGDDWLCNLSICARHWHVGLRKTKQAGFKQLLWMHFSHCTCMNLVEYGVGEITGNSLSNSQFYN